MRITSESTRGEACWLSEALGKRAFQYNANLAVFGKRSTRLSLEEAKPVGKDVGRLCVQRQGYKWCQGLPRRGSHVLGQGKRRLLVEERNDLKAKETKGRSLSEKKKKTVIHEIRMHF